MKLDGVFEGGGVRGIGHVGAVCALEEEGYEWARLAGTSAGSIVAALLACGYTGKELKEIIGNLDYTKFISKTWMHNIPLIGRGLSICFQNGLYKNDYEEEWIESLLLKKGFRYFDDLGNDGRLKIIVSDISSGKMVVIPDDLSQYGLSHKDVTIARAVRMSGTIPFFFQPVKLRIPKSKHPCYIVDGGILSNFPIWIFDDRPEWPTFGFRLVKDEIIGKPIEDGNPISMYKAMFKTMMQAHDLRHLTPEANARTIKISTGKIVSTNFRLTPEEREKLYVFGYQAAKSFLEKWDFEEYKKKYAITNNSST
ncbi:patatin-like phospholipase family protein [Bacillus sp. DX4.1]|uniref:patatin-like phospholipase family protein n=1 Tax=Bacillus sp. DX4.1 TaxID=3055867 RepID=UPI0025A281AE|nr:patatin-like phospholipase family protein [Bacillus sp. DX4.1]MDM5188138.1 patatin-like phospholipase family protein [Bacillus sp. DX4.1]